ncbi:hypothetical protein [Streptomyces sp.]|uniref:hypothetical protein n=1 Tax=Streptomyces sp. TaxID=1931 RepID=UPI002F428B4D
MSEPTPIRPAGPVVRGVVTVRLPVRDGAVHTPMPTAEYGGLEKVPAGSIVRLDIGAAQRCFGFTAAAIAGAVSGAAEVEVVGTDWRGVAETRAQLAAAIEAARHRLTG